MVWVGGWGGGGGGGGGGGVGGGGGEKGGEVESLSQKNTFKGWRNLQFVEKQTKLSKKKF